MEGGRPSDPDDGGPPQRKRAGPRALSRRHGIVEALGPEHRAARNAVHRARARSSGVRRLGARPARDDRRRVPRPRARAVRRDVSRRWTAEAGRVLVRRRHRHEPGPAAIAPGDTPVPDLARRLPHAALRRPGDAETRFREVCRHNLLVNMLSDPASVSEETVDIQVESVRRTRFNSRKVSGGGTLLGDLAALSCQIRLLWGECDDSPFRPAQLLIGEIRAAVGTLDLHRIPRAGHWSAYENAAEVNRLMLEFFSS